MNSVVKAARRLVEHRSGHPVISVYLDLDPERFATPPARASQIRSLVDEASREIERDDTLSHDDLGSLREDLARVNNYLTSREPPFQGARALAVFCCSRDDLFETVQLVRPVPARVVIGSAPYVEPLIAAAQERRWCVVLVSRHTARVLTGLAETLEEQERIEEGRFRQHDQGGWSQARYERSVEKEADDHLRGVAEMVERHWRRERCDRIALGGPQEIVPRFEAMLAEDVRQRLAPGRVDVDINSATDEDIRRAVMELVEHYEKQLEREALDRLAAGVGTGGRAAGGAEDTIAALNERRVATLLLETGFDGRGYRCPSCGLLLLDEQSRCPADDSELEELDHLREAVVEAALAQDADVMVVRHYPDLGPFRGIAALLRF